MYELYLYVKYDRKEAVLSKFGTCTAGSSPLSPYMGREPPVGQGLLTAEASQSHYFR